MSNVQSIPQKTPMLNPKEAIVRCFKKYATFKGRATRAEYWWFILFNSLVCSAVYAAVQFLMGTETADTAMSLVQLALFLPALAVSVRRLHDINFNGWWMMLWITVIGVIPLIVFFCLPGKAEENRFGSREIGAQPDINKQEGGSTNTAGMFLGIITLAGMSFAAPLFMAQTALCEESAAATNADNAETVSDTSFDTSSEPSGESSSSASSSSDTSIIVSAQELEQGLKEVFGGLFMVMEETVGGMTKGMQEGARDMQTRLDGADGTRLITNAKDLAELTETGVLKAEQLEDGSWKIILSVKNTQEFPVRLAGLTDKQQVLLLDQENYAYEQKAGAERLVTVPERAAQKIIFKFPELDGSSPKNIRLYGMDFPVPQPAEIL